MEVQGEIDKFLLASMFRPEIGDTFRALFERFKFDRKKSSEELKRYAEANRLAGKFVRTLGHWTEKLRELREFYRRTSTLRLSRLHLL